MDDIRQQQLDALKMVADYSDRLIPAMTDVIAELKGEQQDDTLAFLAQIIDALNFVIETFNVTRDLVNEKEIVIDEDDLESTVNRLSDAMISKNYEKAAQVMDERVLPFLKTYNASARTLTA